MGFGIAHDLGQALPQSLSTSFGKHFTIKELIPSTFLVTFAGSNELGVSFGESWLSTVVEFTVILESFLMTNGNVVIIKLRVLFKASDSSTVSLIFITSLLFNGSE